MTEERKELDKAELQRAEAAGSKLGEAEKADLITKVSINTALMVVEMISQIVGTPKATA